MGLQFIGLQETAFLLFYGEAEETALVIAGLNELPFHDSIELEGDNHGLFATIHLPLGDVSTMARYLRKYIPGLKMEIHFGAQIPLILRYFPPQEILY